MLADGPTRERAVLMLQGKLPPAGGCRRTRRRRRGGGVDAAAAAAAERRASLLRRVGVLNVSLEAKLLALNDHTTALRKDKAFRHMGLDRRLKIAVRRDDVVASVCRAFAAIKGPSIFKATDVRFVGESGVDRGGISSEMISVFFDALLPAAAAAGDAGSTSDAPDEAAEAPALFEAGDDAGLGWLPARGWWHAARARRTAGGGPRAVQVPARAPPHLSPPSSRRSSSPPSRNGPEDELSRALVPSTDAHAALKSLEHYRPEKAAAMRNLLTTPVAADAPLTVGDLLGDAPYELSPPAPPARAAAARTI